MQDILNFFINMNWLEVIGALTLLLNGLLAVSLVIPGEIPDKQLKAALDFILKFSKK